MSDHLKLTRDAATRTATLWFDRPASRNALTVAMWSAIPALVAQVAADDAVRVLFVRGAGGTFAAGADIAEMPAVYASEAAALANDERIQGAMQALETCAKPTIALIEGACVGGGCGLALACDFRFAAEGARFGITPAKLGLVYGAADSRRLVEAVGLSAARDLLFTGRLVDAGRALAIGLVDEVVAPEELEGFGLEQAARLAAASSWSISAQKEVLGLLRAGADGHPRSRALFGQSFTGRDFQEGYAAFTQKRPPRF